MGLEGSFVYYSDLGTWCGFKDVGLKFIFLGRIYWVGSIDLGLKNRVVGFGEVLKILG